MNTHVPDTHRLAYKCLCVYRALWLPWQPSAGSLPRPQSSKTAAEGQPRSVACLKLSWLLAKLILRDRLQALGVQDTLTGCYTLFLSLSSGLQSHLPNHFKHILTSPPREGLIFPLYRYTIEGPMHLQPQPPSNRQEAVSLLCLLLQARSYRSTYGSC